MIIGYENEVRDVLNTSNANKLRFNYPEAICNQWFETISVEIFCFINVLKFIINNQDVILDWTIESSYDITNFVFIWDRITSK
jgi:hypothetical protein